MPAPVIQFKRGILSNLPGLQVGEPGFTTDSYDLYVGLSSALATNKFVGSHRYWTKDTATTGSGVNLVEGTDNGTNYITLKSPDSLAGNVVYVLPGTQGDASTVLTNDGAGNLTWSSSSVDFTSITTFTSSQEVTLGNPDTGALQVDGGLGVNKSVTVGSAISVSGEALFAGITTFVSAVEISDSVEVGSAVTIADYGVHATGVVTATSFEGAGGELTLGSPTDGSLTDGALTHFTGSTKIVNSIDDLNELALNIIKNTAVTNVDFSGVSTTGGSPLTPTLTITSSGNANRYDIDWGDGDVTYNTSDSTPSHTYTEPDGGTFNITVTAKNSSGTGAGSSQSSTKSNFVLVYTGDPSVSFALYRASSGGSALSGNDLYVVEGQSLYLDNNTTNATQVGSGATYTVNWGDGTDVSFVASNTVGGGASTSADRLQHTWAQGTNSGTGRDTLTLTLNTHATADPAVIPASGTVTLKVYDDAPTAPDGLSSKTLSNVSSTGTSPKLAHGFTDNTGGSTIAAGDDVNRVTTGTAVAGPITSFAYNGDSGTLTANVNGSGDGDVTLASGDQSGTYTSLVVDSESDYQLLDSGGSSTSFANSIYYPGLYKGFKARVSKAVSGLSVGANSMQLSHSATGNTNTVEFVKDDLTANPTTNVGSATLTQNTAGTFRYVSGIPYYNSGSPNLTLAGVTIDDLVGQCYTNQSNIVEVDSGTNQESTSSSAITSSDFTYANIDGSTTMLNSGTPKANTGTSSAYAIGSLTIPITSSSVRTVDRIKVRARNVNGVGNYSSDIATNIQVHTAAQSGISEIAIAAADALGATYDDDGVRIFDFSGETTNTPGFTTTTNYYTNNVYSESADPGISTSTEAVLRLGTIKHDETDYSSGYLPVGPDLSSRSGTQYFTFAFRRTNVASFDINITSAGITGLFIAAPGTNIDATSGLNGWLRADTTYAGAGTPGSGTGGNGSDGCAFTSGDRIQASTALSGGYTMTLGEENMSNAQDNVVLVRIALASGQSVTALSIGEAS